MPRKPPGGRRSRTLRQRAEAVVAREPVGHLVSVPAKDADFRRLAHELAVHRVELEMQNEELRLRSGELAAALQRFTDLYDFAPTGYFSLDRRGAICECNLTGAALLGEARGQLCGRQFGALLAPDSKTAFEAFLEAAWQSEAKTTCEVRRTPDRLPALHLRLEGVPFGGDDARVLRVAAMDVTERVRVDEERRRLSAAVDQTGEAITITNALGVIEYANPAFEAVSGWPRSEAIGQAAAALGAPAIEEGLAAVRASNQPWHGRVLRRRKDAARVVEDTVISPVRGASGTPNYVIIERDVTAEIDREVQAEQARRMETVGRLAGGVAHDLNNMLTPIIGYAEMIAADAGPGAPFAEPAQEILGAAERARDLVRQLLAFGRVQILHIKPVSLNEVIGRLLKLLRRTLRDDIELVASLADRLPLVLADSSQVEQVLMNLAVNAQDAMPDGGRLTIATEEIEAMVLGAGEARGRLEERAACMSVVDTGLGMDPGTRDRAFEPFFTTKGQGKGTGLGLATVYGIVRQHGGQILVETAPGQGTTFRVFWPLAPVLQPAAAETGRSGIASGGAETILVVEDCEPVRELTATILQSFGYHVLVAGSPKEAVELATAYPARIDLLLTDVVMPGGNGIALFHTLASRSRGLRVLYMSGYPRELAAPRDLLDKNAAFIQKPFSTAQLAEQVRRAIGGARGA